MLYGKCCGEVNQYQMPAIQAMSIEENYDYLFRVCLLGDAGILLDEQ